MKRNYRAKYAIAVLLFFLSGCSTSAQISKSAKAALLNDPAIATGHIGISIYEPATGKYWYNHNDTKNFIPASNTKLFTLYAGMKYLGDSLVGLRYSGTSFLSAKDGNKTALIIVPTGDPTFLHPYFKQQPVSDSLKLFSKRFDCFTVADTVWKEDALGFGWAWNDYMDDYMTERSALPVYGNTVTIKKVKFNSDSLRVKTFMNASSYRGQPLPLYYLSSVPVFFESFINKPADINYYHFTNPVDTLQYNYSLKRDIGSNEFYVFPSAKAFTETTIPFATASPYHGSPVTRKYSPASGIITREFSFNEINLHIDLEKKIKWNIIHSQPTDSLFKPMMHRSDNFFAEQTLLMVSNEKLGYMNDEAIIDTILKTDLKDIPQKPRWVDGCGLSRYNLFTPRSFVYILDKMRTEFGMERLKNILATGGTGTLSAYYKKDSGYIFAKTGTLSNNCALSGYLITQKGKLLLFSVLVNNYQSPATPVRRAVERFLQGIREKN